MTQKQPVGGNENQLAYYVMNSDGSMGRKDLETSDEKTHASGQTVFTKQPTRAEPDLEAQDLELADLPIDIRNGFVRKVYGIVLGLLILTFGIALIFVLVEPAGAWLISQPAMYITAMVLLFVFLIALACAPDLDKRVPWNYLVCSGISVCFGIIVGFIGAYYKASVFAIAMGCTALIVLALTVFACQTRWDFTGAGPYLMVALLVLIIFSIVGIFVRAYWLHTTIAAIGVTLFSFFLVYDTQKIVGGKHRKHQFQPDDYILAAVSLYIDVMYIFIFLLQLVGRGGGN